MKAQTKTLIILASLFLISYTGYSVPAEYKNSDNFPYKSTFRQGSDLVINNYYYGDGDYLYDYYYASRIRRFHRPWVSSGYYNSIYTDSYWYTWEPAYLGISIYMGSMWSPVRLGISLGGPASYHYYDPYYFDWYRPVLYTSHVHYFHPTYRMVYRTKIINRYYYGGWFGRHVRYSRPVYAYSYSKPYYSRYYPEYGYYSRSEKGTPAYRNGYPSNRYSVRSDNYSKKSDRSTDVYTGRRRTTGTNTDGNRRTVVNRPDNKNINSGTPVNTRRREVISNTDNNSRVVTSGRTNSDVKRNSATTTNRRSTSYSNTRVVKKSVTTRPSTSGDRSGNISDVSRRSSTGSSTYKSPLRRSSGSSNVSGSSRSGTSYKSSGNRTSNKTVSSRSKRSSSGSKYRKPSSGSSKKTKQFKQSRSTPSKRTKKSRASTSTRRKK